MAAYFLKKHARLHNSGVRLSSNATAALLSCDWPGNVRELENAIVRGIHLCRNDVIEADDLGIAPGTSQATSEIDLGTSRPMSFRATKRLAIEVFEKNYLARLMSEYRGNISRAARASGKERRDLGKLLRKYQLDPKTFRIPAASFPPEP